MSNFIWKEKSAPSNDQSEPNDDRLRYDTADTRPQAPAKSKHWSAELIAHALQKSSEDQSWGVEGMEKAEKIPGGLASGKKQSSFNQKALAVGAKVEIEHTKDPKVAREIAMDHLTEDPRYYEKLAIIEKSDNDDNNNGKADAAIRALLKKNPKPDDSQVHALAGKLGMEVDDIEEKIYAMLGKKLKKSGFEELGDYLEKAHKYVKRTGTPGNYQYEYADKPGPGGAMPTFPTGKPQTKKEAAAFREGMARRPTGKPGSHISAEDRARARAAAEKVGGKKKTASPRLMTVERYNTYANKVQEIKLSKEKDVDELRLKIAAKFEDEIFSSMSKEDRFSYEGTSPAGLLLHFPSQARSLALGDEKAKKSMSGLDTLGNYLKKALPSEETKVTPEKARKILHDGEVGGKPLTEQQRKFFGAIGGHLPAPGKKKTEKSMSDIDALAEHLQKAGPYMGPKGGKWQDAKHTIPWKEGKEKKPKKGEPTKPTELLAARDKLRSHLLTDYERSASPEARAKAESADEALRQFDRAHPEVVTAHIERHRAGLREAMRQMRQAKKTEKSMTTPALETLIDFVETDAEPLSKGMIGGYGINWADRMGGTPFEAEALQCLKALNEIENERGAIQKKYPWREIMDPVDRAKRNKKRSKEHEKIDAKSNAVHKRQNDVEKKYLDWRIEQAKEAKKSEGQDGGEVLEKSEIPTGQPTKIPTGDTSGNPEDGSLLAGQGKSSGTSNPPNPEADQDAQGHPTGAPAPKTQDWSLEEDARRVFGSGTMKSMGPIAQDRAIAESRLRKGKDDVHPYQMSAVHGDSEERTGELSKGGVNEKDPRNAIISRDVLCKGCGGPHSAMLTACPNCGDGLIGQEALAKSNPGVILENPRGAPILQRPKQEKDISVKE